MEKMITLEARLDKLDDSTGFIKAVEFMDRG